MSAYLIDNKDTSIVFKSQYLPDLQNTISTSLFIGPGKSNTRAGYGAFFIKNVKLWSMYNMAIYNTQCNVQDRDRTSYPMLLHYFSFDDDKFVDYYNPKIIGDQKKRSDFIGYNLVDYSRLTNLTTFPTYLTCNNHCFK